ncbi:MAG: hypothetical protein QNI87_01090 [Erythrobacter sp.]|uniref:hypothetical protein n=1 Tax=Erythrobacter sp. TaxID=1042 RepID=UPI0026387174|nr:hypothetical protein [Erythrobacter sp.]MDJ0977113.1 hypothetical protein [Erythrobacter sp.]
MTSALPIFAHGLASLTALLIAVFCPAPGSATRLVQIALLPPEKASANAAVWASQEDAQILAFDPKSASAIVIAPRALSLARSLSYGFVPIASDVPGCSKSEVTRRPRAT